MNLRPAGALRDLVVLSEVRWGYFRTRKQFLLSRFPEPWRVFFAQPPAFGSDDPWQPRQEGRVTTFTIPFLKPGTTSWLYNAAASTAPGRALIEAGASHALRGRLRQLGVGGDPVVMVSNIYCPRTLAGLDKKLVVYDFNDSPFQFSGTPPWAASYWKRTLGQADLVFAVSEVHRRQLVQETARPVVLLGNGVEFDHFARPRPLPPELAALPRPRVGYVGLLSHFLDFELLEAVRRNLRGGTLVLLGPGSPATDRAIADLAARPGVAVLGPRPYEELPAFMQGLDVGLIPFRASDPHVRGINPNKVYQYLAAGLPVVTSPLGDLVESPPDLQFATDAPALERALERALAAGADAAQRRALATPHDWDALAARMVAEIEARLAAA